MGQVSSKRKLEGPCSFDILFAKNVPHVFERIFLSLDYESFKACLGVSNKWNKLLMSESFQKKAKSLFQLNISSDEMKLFNASCHGDFDEVKRLLASSCLMNVNCEGISKRRIHYWKWNPLLHVAKCGQKYIAEMLIDAGADPNINMGHDENGQGPLHWAVKKGYEYVTKILLDGGADVNWVDHYGRTPLHWAAIYGHKHIAQLLLERGTDPNKMDNLWRSPLDHAWIHCNNDIMKLLNVLMCNKFIHST